MFFSDEASRLSTRVFSDFALFAASQDIVNFHQSLFTVPTDARRSSLAADEYLRLNAGYLSSRPQSVSADVYRRARSTRVRSRSAPDLDALLNPPHESRHWGLPLDEYGTLKARKHRKEAATAAAVARGGQGHADLNLGESEARKLLLRDVGEESSVSRVSRWLKNIRNSRDDVTS